MRKQAWLPAIGALLALLGAQTAAGQGAPDRRLDFGAEYAAIGYTGTPEQNPIAQLAARLESGEAQLEHRPGRLYLDSLLAALNIDPGSQALVYSRTSLQGALISAATPRAIYFNDTTYVAWIPGTTMLEIVTTDAALGPVFYILRSGPGAQPEFRRHTGTCLVCHDTYSGKAGGVPLLMVKSVFAARDGAPLTEPIEVTDATPLEERWGGWYVTGRHGGAVHRGNIQVSSEAELADIEHVRRGNLDTLEGLGFFDTEPYLRATSDIVALLVLEHQVSVQNQITYVKFKAPAVLQRMGHADAAAAQSWDALPPQAQAALTRMLEDLTQRMLFVDAAELGDRIESTSGFDSWLRAQGPRDSAGRSLRDLDLQTRLFRYPLSYLIYSEAFDALPPYAKDYVYRTLADVLDGGGGETYAHLTADDRRAIKGILLDTKPDFGG